MLGQSVGEAAFRDPLMVRHLGQSYRPSIIPLDLHLARNTLLGLRAFNVREGRAMDSCHDLDVFPASIVAARRDDRRAVLLYALLLYGDRAVSHR